MLVLKWKTETSARLRSYLFENLVFVAKTIGRYHLESQKVFVKKFSDQNFKNLPHKRHKDANFQNKSIKTLIFKVILF